MKPVNGTARVAAAAAAICVSLSIVWGMASFGYPTSAAAGVSPAAVAIKQGCAPT
jgi:hypothetical protein